MCGLAIDSAWELECQEVRCHAGILSGLEASSSEVSANTVVFCLLCSVPWPSLRVAYVGSSGFWFPRPVTQGVEHGGEQREIFQNLWLATAAVLQR